MSLKSDELDLTRYIRDIPDFPKPGILFRDITPLLASPDAFRQAVCRLAHFARDHKIEAVAAAEARGFLFAAPLAFELGIPLIPIRKRGKLPYHTLSYTYDLEYGSDTMEMHADAVAPGARVLVVDDLLATGGTMDACCRLIERAGGQIAACAFLIELLALGGASRLHDTAFSRSLNIEISNWAIHAAPCHRSIRNREPGRRLCTKRTACATSGGGTMDRKRLWVGLGCFILFGTALSAKSTAEDLLSPLTGPSPCEPRRTAVVVHARNHQVPVPCPPVVHFPGPCPYYGQAMGAPFFNYGYFGAHQHYTCSDHMSYYGDHWDHTCSHGY